MMRVGTSQEIVDEEAGLNGNKGARSEYEWHLQLINQVAILVTHCLLNQASITKIKDRGIKVVDLRRIVHGLQGDFTWVKVSTKRK